MKWPKRFSLLVATLSLCISTSSLGAIRELTDGWSAHVTRTDPFNKNKTEITAIFKSKVIVQCDDFMVRDKPGVFDGFTYGASNLYKIDGQEAVSKGGTYSTGWAGFNTISDQRYFGFILNKKDIESMSNGKVMTIASSLFDNEWENSFLDLSGFAHAYVNMCGENHFDQR